MIFEKLTLHNFGLYRGEQTLDLCPSPENGTHAAPSSSSAASTVVARQRSSTRLSSRSTALVATTQSGPTFRMTISSVIRLTAALPTASVQPSASISGLHWTARSNHTRCGAWYQRGRTLRERVQVSRVDRSPRSVPRGALDRSRRRSDSPRRLSVVFLRRGANPFPRR